MYVEHSEKEHFFFCKIVILTVQHSFGSFPLGNLRSFSVKWKQSVLLLFVARIKVLWWGRCFAFLSCLWLLLSWGFTAFPPGELLRKGSPDDCSVCRCGRAVRVLSHAWSKPRSGPEASTPLRELQEGPTSRQWWDVIEEPGCLLSPWWRAWV